MPSTASTTHEGVGPSGRTVAPFYRVVGVVDDVAQRSAEGQPPLSQDAIAIYYPVGHNPDGRWRPDRDLPAVRRLLAEIDPEAPVTNVRSMQDIVDGAMADVSFISLLLGITACNSALRPNRTAARVWHEDVNRSGLAQARARHARIPSR